MLGFSKILLVTLSVTSVIGVGYGVDTLTRTKSVKKEIESNSKDKEVSHYLDVLGDMIGF